MLTHHESTGVEAASVGSHNTFEVRSFVAAEVAVESFCTVGAGCSLYGSPLHPLDAEAILNEPLSDDCAVEEGYKPTASQMAGIPEEESEQAESAAPKEEAAQQNDIEVIPDRTVVYGYDSKRRMWSGEGVKQQAALHAKHLDYLRDCEHIL